MAQSAAPQPGDTFLLFNGSTSFVEIPSRPEYSIPATGFLTVSSWIRPDVLDFPQAQEDGYVYWLGKGDRSNERGNREWACRIYNLHNTACPPRPSQISFYVFNPAGGLGVGSRSVIPIVAGEWIHVVGLVDETRVRQFRDGIPKDCDTYRGPGSSQCKPFFNEGEQVVVEPRAGAAPVRIGTRDRKSFFLGGVTRVRIWNRLLTEAEITALHESDTASREGLVAEFLLNSDTQTLAVDTVSGNSGAIHDAIWAVQA